MPEVVAASPDAAESGDEDNDAASTEENDFINMMIEVDESYNIPPVDDSHDIAHAVLKSLIETKASRFGRSIYFPIVTYSNECPTITESCTNIQANMLHSK